MKMIINFLYIMYLKPGEGEGEYAGFFTNCYVLDNITPI